MSRSRNKTPTFLFRRGDEDGLEEFYNELDDLSDSSAQLNQSQSEQPLAATPPKKERTSGFAAMMKDKKRERSFEEAEGTIKETTSKWINDIKGRIKEKLDERKREKEMRSAMVDESKKNELDKESPERESCDKRKDSSVKEPEAEQPASELKSPNESDDPEKETVIQSWTLLEFPKEEPDDFEPDEVSEDFLHSPEVEEEADVSQEVTSQVQWSGFTKMVYLTSGGVALVALVVALASPLPAFINGFLFGAFFSFLLLVVLTVFIATKYLIRRVIPRRKSLPRKKLVKKSDDKIYKEWMYEFVGDFENRNTESFQTQLIYVRLHGSNLRLSKPKHNVKKSRIDSSSLPVFVSQRFYDLSKMSHKKISIIFPKTIRNRKKYLWSKKFPLCLELEDIKTKNTFKLVLFIRNCREKEEWFWRFKEVIDSKIEEKEEKIVSVPSSPVAIGDVISAELEQLPRTHSLDLSFQTSRSAPSTTPSTPSKERIELQIQKKDIDYNRFMKSVINFRSTQTSSLAWFNAFLGRACFDILNDPFWSNLVAVKIQRKLRKLRLPYFMEALTLSEIDLGTNLPKFNHVTKPPKYDSQGLWVEFDMSYSGGFTMTLETKLNLMKLKEQGTRLNQDQNATDSFSNDVDLSDNESDSILSSSEDENDESALDPDDADSTKKQQKFLKFVDKIAATHYFQRATEIKYIRGKMERFSNVPLILTVHIQTLNGILVFNIPPPPTDRLWYGFRAQPDLVLSARPKVGEHEIGIHHVTDLIERKLRAEFAKVLVMPNMDDFVIPVLRVNVDQMVNLVP